MHTVNVYRYMAQLALFYSVFPIITRRTIKRARSRLLIDRCAEWATSQAVVAVVVAAKWVQ